MTTGGVDTEVIRIKKVDQHKRRKMFKTTDLNHPSCTT